MHHKQLLNGLVGATALLLAGAHVVPGSDASARLIAAAPVVVEPSLLSPAGYEIAENGIAAKTNAALRTLGSSVQSLSHPDALETAFSSYFAFLSKHPSRVRKPYLYFVDYGLPSTQPRGWVFDMQTLEVVDGPFAVAHGRGSTNAQYGVPTQFSNKPGSNATSLGLYLAQETYGFRGNAGGRKYTSIGLRLEGLSGRYNSNARRRGVVAHGAPYVSATTAGRSEGCPAMEQSRAQRLLPKLSRGGMVFLFAPNEDWLSDDPWIVAAIE
ncbi:MAG: murein L,D-transpeptidase catalytic domain-containing protein [Gemmatimonadaceae bacterium]